jgi:transcriptional regulator with XRE-family HTH domain
MDKPNTTVTETTAKPIPPATVVAWREAMGFTQRDAAEALGCSRTALVAWEHGTNDCPKYIGLAMAALALGMTPYGVEEKENV